MTDTLEGDKRRLSNRVSRIVSLVDLHVREIEARLLVPTVKPPMKPTDPVFRIVAGRVGHFAVYEVFYRLGAKDSNKEEAFRARLVLSLVFDLHDAEITNAEAEAFGAYGVLEIAHPYVREIIHSLTFRMGLPPFVLDVAPALGDD